MKIRPLPIKALFLAPLASIPAVTLSGLGSSDAGIASDFEWGVFFAIALAFPASFLAMLVIGLPLFILLRRYNVFSLPVVCAIGIAVPYILFNAAPFGTIVAAISAGFAVSVSAYFLRPRETEYSK